MHPEQIAAMRTDLANVLNERDALAARYRWIRAAWLEGADDNTDPVRLRAIQDAMTDAEMDAAIDAELAKAGASST